MKKKILIAALAAVIALLCACNKSPADPNNNRVVIPENTGFSQTFAASELSSGSRDVWGKLEGDNWVCTRPPTNGYVDELITHTETFVLEKGYYALTVRASVDDNVFSAADNYPENDMLFYFRVVDAKSGKQIAIKEVYRQQFDDAEKMQDFTVTFASAKNCQAYIQARSSNTAVITLNSFKLQGIAKSAHVATDFTGYFAESIDDRFLTYDDGALYYFDLYEYLLPSDDSVFSYDVSAMIFALQGLVNRDGQHLFVRFNAPNDKQYDQDNFWLAYLRQDGGILAGKNIVTVERPATLLRLFSDYYEGFVVWDNEVPASVNAAFTAAGVDGLLPLRYLTKEQSLYRILTGKKYNAEIKLDLNNRFRSASGKVWDTNVNSTGSPKNDVYAWAYEKYLATGKTNPTLIAYHLDAYSWDKSGVSTIYSNVQQLMLANKDYYVANKCFFFDTHVFADSIPNDDPDQKKGTDFATFDKILRKQNALADGELFTLGGFVPWWIKYSQSADPSLPRAVACEWQFVQALGGYYGVKDADAYGYTSLANASIYSKVPQPEKYAQVQNNSKEEIAKRAAKYIDTNGQVKNNNYIMVYMGDYDAGAWLAMAMGNNFNDALRGELPLCWPVNPTGLSRVPMVANYMYERQTPNDYFVGDHNGYGYIELMNIGTEEGLHGSLDDFAELTRKAWEHYDLDIMGFVINTTGVGYSPKILKWVSDISPYGVVTNMGVSLQGDPVVNSSGKTVLWTPHMDFKGGVSAIENVDYLNSKLSVPTAPRFMTVRPILYSPTYINEVFRRMRDPNDPRYREGYNVEVVDPYVYFYLMELNAGVNK